MPTPSRKRPRTFPDRPALSVGPEPYLEQIRRIKAAVRVPVIGSLNGTTATGWLDYARLIQQAGADALELNFYVVATDPLENGQTVEQRALDILRKVKASVTIPVAVKLSPFFCSFAHFASQLDGLGADGLVLFNRFYQPDIDVETLEVVPRLQLSDSSELLLRLRWLAILSGHLRASLAVTGGVHTADGCDQSRHGRGPCGAAGVGATPARAGASQNDSRGDGPMDGRA